jgi:hypothetical protein
MGLLCFIIFVKYYFLLFQNTWPLADVKSMLNDRVHAMTLQCMHAVSVCIIEIVAWRKQTCTARALHALDHLTWVRPSADVKSMLNDLVHAMTLQCMHAFSVCIIEIVVYAWRKQTCTARALHAVANAMFFSLKLLICEPYNFALARLGVP